VDLEDRDRAHGSSLSRLAPPVTGHGAGVPADADPPRTTGGSTRMAVMSRPRRGSGARSATPYRRCSVRPSG